MDFLKRKKMRNVRTIILAAVSRRDLYYVSENESFCFEQNKSVVYRAQSEVKNKKLTPSCSFDKKVTSKVYKQKNSIYSWQRTGIFLPKTKTFVF